MAVNNTASRNQYTATASQTVFPYTFEIIQDNDITVDQGGTILSEGTHYTVSGVGVDTGGNITLITGATSGDIITIYRSMALERLTDYQQNGDFLATEVNDDLDRLWMAQQQLDTNLGSAIRPSITDSVLNSTNTELANVTTRANKALGFTATGALDYISGTMPVGALREYSTLAAAVADAAAMSVGDAIYLEERSTGDGGGAWWKAITSTTNNTYDIVDTPLNTAISLKLIIDSHFNAESYGVPASGDATVAFKSFLEYCKTNALKARYNTEYFLDNLLLTGYNDTHAVAGPAGILNFNLVSSGTGLDINFDVTVGGSQRNLWENLKVKDDRATSLVDTMFKFQSGPTGESPAQTSGFLTITNGQCLEYNNSSGIVRHLQDVSHVTFHDWQDAFALGAGESLFIENSISINTGVMDFYNDVKRCVVRPIRIKAASELIDTINFFGGFVGNNDSASAADCMTIEGTVGVAGLNFYGGHWECHDNADDKVILVTGKLRNHSFQGVHFSCGDVTNQIQYLVKCTGTAEIKAGLYKSNEVLRLKDTSNSGSIFYFDNTVVTDTSSPLDASGWNLNSTAPDIAEYASGGNEDTIRDSVIVNGIQGHRYYSIGAGTAISFTPRNSEGQITISSNNSITTNGTVAYRAEATPQTALLAGGGDLEVTTGVLSGTTGSSSKVTVSAHTDGKIYIESRLGTQQLTVKISSEFKVIA